MATNFESFFSHDTFVFGSDEIATNPTEGWIALTIPLFDNEEQLARINQQSCYNKLWKVDEKRVENCITE